MRGFCKYLNVVIFALLIISVAGSSVYSSLNSKKTNVEVKLDKKKDKQETVSAPQQMVALIPFIHFDLVKDFYLIRVFKFPIKKVFYYNISQIPFTIKYFKALFCFVISPNAP